MVIMIVFLILAGELYYFCNMIMDIPILQKRAYILARMFSWTSTMAWLGQDDGSEMIPELS